MQRLKETFRRKLSSGDPLVKQEASSFGKKNSREKQDYQLTIPTGRQVRSSSFDESVFKKAGLDMENLTMGRNFTGSTLEIPTPSGRSCRSKSFDSVAVKQKKTRSSQGAIGFLEIPKWRMLIRRSSSQSTDRGSLVNIFGEKCIHCSLVEEASILLMSSARSSISSQGSPDVGPGGPNSVLFEGRNEDDESEYEDGTGRQHMQQLKQATGRSGNGFFRATNSTNLENSLGLNDEFLLSPEDGLPMVTLSAAPEFEEQSPEEEDLGNGITVISLEVPVVKQTRSASIDASFLKVPDRRDLTGGERPPCKTHRSHSVDITLPTKPGEIYMVVRSMKRTPVFEK